MVATLILMQDDEVNLHDQEGHLRNVAGQRIIDQGMQSLIQKLRLLQQLLELQKKPAEIYHWLTTTVQINTMPTDLLSILQTYRGLILR
ncbi:hypothetical protein Bca4012_010318 [Brassica carinata]